MPADLSSDSDFRKEARAWAGLAHDNPVMGAAQRVGRLVSMLESAEQKLMRANARARQLESMMEELFAAYMASEANLKRLQRERDEWKHRAHDLQAEFGVPFAMDADVVVLLDEGAEKQLQESRTELARELENARDEILGLIATFARLAPGSMRAALAMDVHRILQSTAS